MAILLKYSEVKRAKRFTEEQLMELIADGSIIDDRREEQYGYHAMSDIPQYMVDPRNWDGFKRIHPGAYEEFKMTASRMPDPEGDRVLYVRGCHASVIEFPPDMSELDIVAWWAGKGFEVMPWTCEVWTEEGTMSSRGWYMLYLYYKSSEFLVTSLLNGRTVKWQEVLDVSEGG